MSNSLQNAANETKKDSYVSIGAGVFAVLNIFATSIALLLCVAVLIMSIIESVTGTDKLAFVWSMFAVNLFVAMVFMFAALLFLGMYQREPSYVLAYLIFGVTIEIYLVSVVVIFNYIGTHIPDGTNKRIRELVDYNAEIASKLIIAICLVYTLLLCMIYRAWILMRSKVCRRPSKADPSEHRADSLNRGG